MKNLRKIFSIVAVGAALIFSSCEKSPWADAKRGPSPEVAGLGVYLSPTEIVDMAKIDLEPGDSLFTFTVYRTNDVDQPAVVPVQINGEADLFDYPSTVTIPAGEIKTELPVTFDTDELTPGKYYAMTLSFGDESMTTPYGLSELNFTAGMIKWVPWAKGIYHSGIIEWYDENDEPINDLEFTLYQGESTKLFRFQDVYAEGYNYVFEWDIAKLSLSIVPQGVASNGAVGQNTGLAYNATSYIWLYTNTNGSVTYYDPEIQTLVLNSGNEVFTTGGVYLGGFGVADETFKITEFLLGNPWAATEEEEEGE